MHTGISPDFSLFLNFLRWSCLLQLYRGTNNAIERNLSVLQTGPFPISFLSVMVNLSSQLWGIQSHLGSGASGSSSVVFIMINWSGKICQLWDNQQSPEPGSILPVYWESKWSCDRDANDFEGMKGWDIMESCFSFKEVKQCVTGSQALQRGLDNIVRVCEGEVQNPGHWRHQDRGTSTLESFRRGMELVSKRSYRCCRQQSRGSGTTYYLSPGEPSQFQHKAQVPSVELQALLFVLLLIWFCFVLMFLYFVFRTEIFILCHSMFKCVICYFGYGNFQLKDHLVSQMKCGLWTSRLLDCSFL